MTEEQKRFKILKRESLEDKISQEDKKITTKTFLTGFAAIATICGFLSAARSDEISFISAMIGLGSVNTFFTSYQLKGLIEAIRRKTLLQGKIEDINTELKMPEEEKSRGKNR